MEIKFTVDTPVKMSQVYKESFLTLLAKQGQADNPNMKKISESNLICIVHDGPKAIGIGAIKHVSKAAFRKANAELLAPYFGEELGYLYVNSDETYRGLGIGKTICKFLLHSLGNKNVFATTAVGESANNMKYILENLGFVKEGITYFGAKTQKPIGLFLKYGTTESVNGKRTAQ